MIQPTQLTTELEAALDYLADDILQTEPLHTFKAAQDAMNADDDAEELIARYMEAQNAYRQHQMAGTLTQSHIDNIRRLHGEVEAHPIIAQSVNAQMPVRELLDTLTTELSRELGIDFPTFAVPSSC